MAHEARALLARIAVIRPFVLHETMVVAAALSTAAQTAIESYLAQGRRGLAAEVRAFLSWLSGPEAARTRPEELQRRFTLLRLRFNTVLSQFDIFSIAVTQRSENGIGVWLAGLDTLASDALVLPGDYYEPPPLVCYLDRGLGAAIRRARTRLPGGGENPVAIIRVPRERMVGAGIASSLIHEVGHQGAALLGLLPSLRDPLVRAIRGAGPDARHWDAWYRWISEIVADFWSVATLGIAASLGLMAVVSLPSVFVFRDNKDDPHPTPWIRMKLSCEMGNLLYPHPQWARLSSLWEQLYPTHRLAPSQRAELSGLLRTMPAFVRLLAGHRPPALRGRRLADAFPLGERQPARLADLAKQAARDPSLLRRMRPALVFAVMGQGRVSGHLGPEVESKLLEGLLTEWAVKSALDQSAACATLPRRAMAA